MIMAVAIGLFCSSLCPGIFRENRERERERPSHQHPGLPYASCVPTPPTDTKHTCYGASGSRQCKMAAFRQLNVGQVRTDLKVFIGRHVGNARINSPQPGAQHYL